MTSRNRYATAALLAALALALAALAGCGDTTNVTSAAAANTVTSSGAGTTQAPPDTAEMSFGVTTMSSNAKTALEDASKAAAQIAAAVKKQGIADEDIQTQDVSVYPQTVDQDGKQVISGYQASLSVRVKVRDIAKLGEIISAANATGANSINGPMFTVDDPAPARAEAIDEAVADARKSAEAMAEAAGKSVGEVLSMSSSDVGMVPIDVRRVRRGRGGEVGAHRAGSARHQRERGRGLRAQVAPLGQAGPARSGPARLPGGCSSLCGQPARLRERRGRAIRWPCSPGRCSQRRHPRRPLSQAGS